MEFVVTQITCKSPLSFFRRINSLISLRKWYQNLKYVASVGIHKLYVWVPWNPITFTHNLLKSWFPKPFNRQFLLSIDKQQQSRYAIAPGFTNLCISISIPHISQRFGQCFLSMIMNFNCKCLFILDKMKSCTKSYCLLFSTRSKKSPLVHFNKCLFIINKESRFYNSSSDGF